MMTDVNCQQILITLRTAFKNFFIAYISIGKSLLCLVFLLYVTFNNGVDDLHGFDSNRPSLLMILFYIFCLAEIVFAIFLLYGIKEKNTKLILPWIILYIALEVTLGFSIVIASKNNADPKYITTYIFFFLAHMCALYYVVNFCSKMHRENTQGQQNIHNLTPAQIGAMLRNRLNGDPDPLPVSRRLSDNPPSYEECTQSGTVSMATSVSTLHDVAEVPPPKYIECFPAYVKEEEVNNKDQHVV